MKQTTIMTIRTFDRDQTDVCENETESSPWKALVYENDQLLIAETFLLVALIPHPEEMYLIDYVSFTIRLTHMLFFSTEKLFYYTCIMCVSPSRKFLQTPSTFA